MTIYRLSEGLDQYGFLMFDGGMLLDRLGRRVFRSLSSLTTDIADQWPACHDWFITKEGDVDIKDRPDVYIFNFTMLVLSPQAMLHLKTPLAHWGEFLPFDCGEEIYHLFVTHSVIAADESVSELRLENELMSGTNKLGFRVEDVGTNLVFKTDYDRFMNVFCTERFKQIVEKHQLKGVFFERDLAKAID